MAVIRFTLDPLYIPYTLFGYLEPESRGLHAPLSSAFRQGELALHIFEGGLAFQTRHLPEQCRTEPAMCVLFIQEWCNMFRSTEKLHALVRHLCALAIPNVSVVDLSSILVDVGS